jgi:hypothetical protein
MTGSATAATGAPFKTESSTAKSSPQKQKHRDPDYRQRNPLLPIHGRKITSKSLRATNDSESAGVHFAARGSKGGNPVF